MKTSDVGLSLRMEVYLLLGYKFRKFCESDNMMSYFLDHLCLLYSINYNISAFITFIISSTVKPKWTIYFRLI